MPYPPEDRAPPVVEPIVELARAKINLTLKILGRRADGYHELQSLVAFAAAGDVVTLTPTGPGSNPAFAVEVTGPYGSAIVGDNLVVKTLHAVENSAGRPLAARLILEKHLPVASGIGGGSADAAAVLRALQRAYPELRTAVDWQQIAASLGADVPVCLASRPAWMTGIGEQLHPVVLPRLEIVLANPGVPVPADKTRRVFQALVAKPLAGEPSGATAAATALPTRLARQDVLDLMQRHGNDLEAAATSVTPAIAAVKAALSASPGCLAATLSGAGPTVVGVFASEREAAAAAARLAARHPQWWLTATHTATVPDATVPDATVPAATVPAATVPAATVPAA